MESSTHEHKSEAAEERHKLGHSDAGAFPALTAQALPQATTLRLQRAGAPPWTPSDVRALQRSVGNRAFARMLGTTVQRHPEGAELPDKDDQLAEIQDKEQEAPAATRTKAEETAQTGEASKAGKAFQKSQKLTPGAMSLASAQKILQGAFGGLKDIVPGSIQILADQPACAAKYDEVCIAGGVKRPDGSAWKAGDCAKDDAAAGVLTQGFAWGGVVYVNGKTTLVTATAHEILHNNTAGGFRAKVGETLNEGCTELLARRALSVAGITVPSITAYPEQVKFTVRLQGVVGQQTIVDAYFGGADKLVKKFEELKGASTWDAMKVHAEALDEPEFDKALKAKKA